MFSIPNLPTDSLYKFIFLSGVALILYSSYLETNQRKDLSKDKVSTDSMRVTVAVIKETDSLYNMESERTIISLTKSLETISKNLDVLKKANKFNSRAHNSTVIELKELLKKLNHEKLKGDSIRKKLSTDKINSTIYLSKMDMKILGHEETLRDVQQYLYFGFSLLIFGFLSWYIIVQKPQDELNKVTLRLAKLNLARELRAERALIAPPTPNEDSEQTT